MEKQRKIFAYICDARRLTATEIRQMGERIKPSFGHVTITQARYGPVKATMQSAGRDNTYYALAMWIDGYLRAIGASRPASMDSVNRVNARILAQQREKRCKTRRS